VLERSLMYAKTFSVPADNPDDTLAVLLSDGTSAEVSWALDSYLTSSVTVEQELVSFFM
jgi:hypothetical protein